MYKLVLGWVTVWWVFLFIWDLYQPKAQCLSGIYSDFIYVSKQCFRRFIIGHNLYVFLKLVLRQLDNYLLS